MSKLLIKNVKVIATVDNKKTRIENGAIYIEDNVIKDIGSTTDLERKYLTVNRKPLTVHQIIDATDKVALPGLINTHHHL